MKIGKLFKQNAVNRIKNNVAFVVCSGYSIKSIDFNLFEKMENYGAIIAVNYTHAFFDNPIVSAMDKIVIEELYERDYDISMISNTHHPVKNIDACCILTREDDYIEGYTKPCSSGDMGIWGAYKLGASIIVVIGMDMYCHSHFYSDDVSELVHKSWRNETRLNTLHYAFDHIQKTTPIINCCKESWLTSKFGIHYVPLKNLLK